MKLLALCIATSAAVASAQGVSYNESTGIFTCFESDGAYCAGDSLGTDIIIRCNGLIGQPGRCGNNLAGQPPLGVQPARCWSAGPNSGVAACEKNCVVYGSSGNYEGDFTLPQCTPYYTTTTSVPTSTLTLTNPTQPPTTTLTTASTSSNTTQTLTSVSSSVTTTPSFSANFTTITATSTPPGGNTTSTTIVVNPPTKTPAGPSTSIRPTFVPAAGSANTAGFGLAALGLAFALAI